MNKLIPLFASTMLLTGCITFPTYESNQVKVEFHNEAAIANCEHKGTVIGSEGGFFDYWLHADKDMVWGTLNVMRLKASELGADTLYLFEPLPFTGSVTMLGNAYLCQPKEVIITPMAPTPPAK